MGGYICVLKSEIVQNLKIYSAPYYVQYVQCARKKHDRKHVSETMVLFFGVTSRHT